VAQPVDLGKNFGKKLASLCLPSTGREKNHMLSILGKIFRRIWKIKKI
jgi:hypothetical protein